MIFAVDYYNDIDPTASQKLVRSQNLKQASTPPSEKHMNKVSKTIKSNVILKSRIKTIVLFFFVFILSACTTQDASEDINSVCTKGFRSNESIRKIVEAHKGKLFLLYAREVENNPSLKGELIFNFKVQPTGELTELKFIKKAFEDDELNMKLFEKLKELNFGKADVCVRDITYRFMFFPS